MRAVPAAGPANARIMIVGEAPGKYEEAEGQPFVGPAGKMLRSFLLRAGIRVEDCWLTNICKYRPPDNKLEKFFLPGGHPDAPVILGLAELEQEILRVRPNVIMAAGNFAMWALTGKGKWNETATDTKTRGFGGIYDWRGSILECTLVSGFKVIPTFHPSFINQEGYFEHGTWTADLTRIKSQSEFPEIRRPVKNVRLDPNFQTKQQFRQDVFSRVSDPASILTFDIEYIGNKLVCVGMTLDRDNPIVIPTRNQAEVNYCRDILTCGIGLNAQNSMFDCSILEWWYQMPIMQFMRFDTMFAAHATNIELPKGLDYLCSIYTEQPYYKDMINWKKVKEGKQPFSDVYRYNAIDTWVQHEVMEEQLKYDLIDPIARMVFEFEMQLLNPLWQISKKGVRVDRDAIDALSKQLADEVAGMNAVLNMTMGRTINVSSYIDLGWMLFDQFGLKPVRMTKKGPSTDDKTLSVLQGRTDPESDVHKLIKIVREIKVRRSLKSKFTDIELDDDGRLRGHYNPAGTDTGRLASKKFYPTGRGANQQNPPRDKRVRRVFLPDRGKKFGYADLERAESLVVSYLTLDPEMLRVHAPGVDAHRELASQLFDCSLEEVTDDQRYLGKKTRHAGNYMQGPQRFMTEINKEADKTGVSIDFAEAKRYIETYRRIHPNLPVWWEEIKSQLIESRMLFNLLGRQRTFYGVRNTGGNEVSELPNAVAYIPQSTVGDTLNVGLLQLSGVACQYARKRGIVGRISEHVGALRAGGFEILQQIHDAIGFHYYESHEEEVLYAVKELMRVPLTVPKTGEEFEIPVEIQVGPSWGDCKLWHSTKNAA